METKKCYKCAGIKPLSDYYKTKTGTSAMCKDCARQYSYDRYSKLRQDEDFMKRQREGKRGSYSKAVKDRFQAKYPEKLKGERAIYKLPKKQGFDNHHWSYNDEHLTDIIPLPVKTHSTAHRSMIYDQERKMYRRVDNNLLLDSKESHVEYINSLPI